MRIFCQFCALALCAFQRWAPVAMAANAGGGIMNFPPLLSKILFLFFIFNNFFTMKLCKILNHQLAI